MIALVKDNDARRQWLADTHDIAQGAVDSILAGDELETAAARLWLENMTNDGRGLAAVLSLIAAGCKTCDVYVASSGLEVPA